MYVYPFEIKRLIGKALDDRRLTDGFQIDLDLGTLRNLVKGLS